MLDVDMAKLEISRKSMSDIHTDTAWKWASRAVAAYETSLGMIGVNKSLRFNEGQEYASEAKEHAAQVGSIFLEKIEIAISKPMIDALLSLDKSFKESTNV